MKPTIFYTLILFLCCSTTAQFQEVYVGQVYADIEKSIHTYSDTLKLDFYTAKEAKENRDRPLLVLVHGGGFSGGKRDNPMESKFSQTMAAKGYAVASISYTLSRKGKSTGFGCDCPAAEKLETFEATSQDILSAVAYLNGNGEFMFDRSKVVLVGSSAGAEGVLNTTYMRYHPAFKDLNFSATTFAAVVSLAGAVVDARYIEQGNAIPGFFIHGAKDTMVPYVSAAHHYCDLEDVGFLPLDGDKTIAHRLKQLDASYMLCTATEGNHDWANFGYTYVDEIAEFLNAVVVKNEKVQGEKIVERK